MFDITQHAVAETAAIHLKSAEGVFLYDADGRPLRIVIYGPGSKQFAAIESRQTQRSLNRMHDNDGKVALGSPEERIKEQAEDLAAITAAFENFGYPPAGDKQGAPLFEAFYADRTLGHFVQQVVKACKDWGKFQPALPTS